MRLEAEVENPPAGRPPRDAAHVLFRVDATSHRIEVVLRNRHNQKMFSWWRCGPSGGRGQIRGSSVLLRVTRKVS
jgi:hypothetical protein